MKYETIVIIEKPISEVIKKLDNPENMKHWQRGLIGYELIHGKEPGTTGAQMKLRYKMGKSEMVMTETVIKNDFPSEFHASYNTKSVDNIQKNYFTVIDEHTTQWHSESEFIFKNFMMKAMGFLMPGAFKKQSKKYLNDFKNFVENGTSVQENK
ncbi:MAG: SRPBCC family protein [Patiriisocius sp.]|uniref:SRPBCC family protein n=1 Tax=Patiriisocius sp. TaxID=2822396 RepID=UPI003EF83B99